MADTVHVAVAVLVNTNDEVCISLRHKDAHQGGLWEFPGGKVEADETVEQALIREIREELNVDIKQLRQFIKINHSYDDHDREQRKTVCLHVCKVLSYQGEAAGAEGQQVKWVPVAQLDRYQFPAANRAIIKALQLPDRYLITGKFTDTDDFIYKLKNALDSGITLVQLRLKKNSVKDIDQAKALITSSAALCQQAGATLMLNLDTLYRDSVDLSQLAFSGFHADSKTLRKCSLDAAAFSADGKLFSASCHNIEELMIAEQLKADFVVLSPVQKTSSHPDMPAMGWPMFSKLIESIPIPVYALGGVSDKDLETAWLHGAQGIAAISALWEKSAD